LVAWLGGRLLRHQELSPQSASQNDLGPRDDYTA